MDDTCEARISSGTIIGGRYRVQHVIGRGGHAIVFRAEHVRTGHGVALKVLSGTGQGGTRAAQRFFREAKVTANLRHPSTVRVFDFGEEDDGLVFMAMELLTGRSVRDELILRARKRRVFSEAEAIEIAICVTNSLCEAHAAGLVHRDLKPANLFLHSVPGNHPVVKVLDFGIARVASGTLTEPNAALGTPAYMSPEQTRGDELDGRSDLYTLGAVLYRLVSGMRPFAGQTAREMMIAHSNQPVPDLRVTAKTPISERFRTLVERALAKSPSDRFADAAEMRAALQACRESARTRTRARSLPQATRPAPDYGRWLIALWTFVALMLLHSPSGLR